MGSGIEILFILLMFFSGGPRGGTDLLDMVPADSYWQLKKVTLSVEQLQRDASADKPPESIDKLLKDLQSDDFKTRESAKKQLESMGPPIIPQLKVAAESKDPEVAATAGELITHFLQRGQEREIRRLMAIRTLGERKETGALPFLKTLLDSKELFVADYARRSISEIDGSPLPVSDRKKDLQYDAALLPKNLSIVTQFTGIARQQLNLAAIIDMIADGPDPMHDALQPGDAPPPPPDKKKMLVNATAQVLKLLEKTGNMSFEAATLGVAENIGGDGGDGGFATCIIRGKYNAPVVHAVLKSYIQSDNPGNESIKDWNEGGISILEIESEIALIFASNDQLILVMGDTKNRAAAVDAMVAAAKAGKGEIADNKDLAPLLKSVDTTLPIWGVARLNKAMKELSYLTPFDNLLIEGKTSKDGLTFSIRGQGTDLDKIKTTVEQLNKDLQVLVAQGKQQAAQQKGMQPVVDFVESMKAAVDPAGASAATLTGEIKSSIVGAMLSQLGFLVRPLLEPEPDTTQPAGAVEGVGRIRIP